MYNPAMVATQQNTQVRYMVEATFCHMVFTEFANLARNLKLQQDSQFTKTSSLFYTDAINVGNFGVVGFLIKIDARYDTTSLECKYATSAGEYMNYVSVVAKSNQCSIVQKINGNDIGKNVNMQLLEELKTPEMDKRMIFEEIQRMINQYNGVVIDPFIPIGEILSKNLSQVYVYLQQIGGMCGNNISLMFEVLRGSRLQFDTQNTYSQVKETASLIDGIFQFSSGFDIIPVPAMGVNGQVGWTYQIQSSYLISRSVKDDGHFGIMR